MTRPVDAQAPFAGSVLVIDDDPELRESMQRLLAEWQHPVLVAASREDALALAERYPDDIRLIVSDYRLADDVTGIEVVEAVRHRLGRQVPAVIVTGDTSAQPIAEAARHGFRLIYKPVEPQVLAALMTSIR